MSMTLDIKKSIDNINTYNSQDDKNILRVVHKGGEKYLEITSKNQMNFGQKILAFFGLSSFNLKNVLKVANQLVGNQNLKENDVKILSDFTQRISKQLNNNQNPFRFVNTTKKIINNMNHILTEKTKNVLTTNNSTPPNSPSKLKPENISPIETPIPFSPPRIEIIRGFTEKILSYTAETVSKDDKGTSKLEIKFPDRVNVDISIRREDIFNSKADIIVNAANTHLGGGGGIDGAIHKKGGIKYANEHKKLQELYNENYKKGYAALIGGGDIKDLEIIVVAGPSGKSTDTKKDQLYSCYCNSLLLAHLQNKKSIAFPSISTGIFGYPKEEAAKISLQAIHDFLEQYEKTSVKTISIHFTPEEYPEKSIDFYKKKLRTRDQLI